MADLQGFDFFRMTYDKDGKPSTASELDALVARANAVAATDAIVIAHGFRNDESDATTVYSDFLKSLGGQLKRPEFHDLAARRFVVGGVYWPSKSFRESYGESAAGTRGVADPRETMAAIRSRLEEFQKDATPAQRGHLDRAIALLPSLGTSAPAQDEFVRLVLTLLDHVHPDPTEGLPQIRQRTGSEILARLSSSETDDHTRGIGDVLGKIGGGVGTFLNLTTWYMMKDRSGTVGAKGVATAVRQMHAARSVMRIHLVGHSLGGRLMASCAKALCDAPRLQPDSLTLLEAAFSHFGFSADNGHGVPGFFRAVVATQLVKGPFLSTFSAQDTVVGHAYSIMSRLVGDNTREIGDANDDFGGIGRNGALKTVEVASAPLHKPGVPYRFQSHVINNLDGSGGFIKNHGDVTSDAITYAFASAVAET